MFLNRQMQLGRLYARYINALDATKINKINKQKQNEFWSKILARHLKIAS